MIFEELELDPKWNYYQGKKKLEKGNILFKGDNWITYKSLLKGGKPEFQDVMVELYVIYTSTDKFNSSNII
jgi:hypothetical protein